MYNPVRGGQGDFKWSDVAADKDREHYLGHSILAPVGRWQNGRDLTWYNKGKDQTRDEIERQRRRELRKIKEAEEDALALALGHAPAVRKPSPAFGQSPSPPRDDSVEPHEKALTKEVKYREKEQRRLEKEARRAERATKREERSRHESSSHDQRQHSSHTHHQRPRESSPRRSSGAHGDCTDGPASLDRRRLGEQVRYSGDSRWRHDDGRNGGDRHERDRRDRPAYPDDRPSAYRTQAREGPERRRRSDEQDSGRRHEHDASSSRQRSRSPVRPRH
ncbi:BQ2448_5188 [Microbotryum intermedium]|uniref:BQ2448_5188 protein n=1 Tax=Microbotryum intermedium TaxID=269621 RepID=A0A238F3E5_9BASI|nr:BQ2448_5188 [Microbotryum intermedium]